MLSGQTQLKYGEREEALEPESIEGFIDMMDLTTPGRKIRNHKSISGVMIIEVVVDDRDLPRRSHVRHHLVAGQDPYEAGTIVTMHLSDKEQSLLTRHMSSLKDTRGGFSEVAWCSSLQLKGLTKSGISSSCNAYEKTRREYCIDLLNVLDDTKPFQDQDWQAFQRVIASRSYLLRDLSGQQKSVAAKSVDVQNDDSDADSSPSSPSSFSSSFSNNDDEQGGNKRNEQFSSRRLGLHDTGTQTEDAQEDANQNLKRTMGVDYKNFNVVGSDITPVDTSRSPKRPKLKHQFEPGLEVITTIENTRLRNIINFIDLTGEPDTTDEFVRSGSSNIMVINLTEVGDLVVKRNSSGIELIELED